MSQLERGDGSFSAEQLLLLSQLFNVAPTDFTTAGSLDRHAGLQNALARFGAKHLRESELSPSKEISLPRAFRDALASGEARLITALAAVLVQTIDELNLVELRATLADAGLNRRFAWLVENVLIAIDHELSRSLSREWRRRYLRASAVLEIERDALNANLSSPAPVDLLDPQIRSAKTRREVEAASSEPSRRWGIVTRLQPEDFTSALEATRVSH